MKLRSTIAFLLIAVAVCAEELPRKTKSPRESYPNVDVIYDSVTTPHGERLRTIITKPRNAKGKLPDLRCWVVELRFGGSAGGHERRERTCLSWSRSSSRF